MPKKSPFWLIALLLLGMAALVPLVARAQSSRTRPAQKPAAKAQSPAATPAAAPPVDPNLPLKRLVLKDGSWQGIIKYEVKGETVRYLSSERYEWEDIPASLIDWAATEKYAREQIAGEASHTNAHAVDAEEEAERKAEEEQTPEVAHGIRLPLQGGVHLLDVYNKEAQLDELQQNLGDVKRNTGKNILRSAINPIASQKQSVQLSGAHAKVQSHVADPFIYVNVDSGQDASGPKPLPSEKRFRLVRLESDAKKNVRVVGNIKIAVWGKVSSEETAVPVNIEKFSGPWVKITPTEPLAPGEYALVEVFEDNQINRFVWDFGVDPKAPANPGAWKPEPAKAAAQSSETPQLKKK